MRYMRKSANIVGKTGADSALPLSRMRHDVLKEISGEIPNVRMRIMDTGWILADHCHSRQSATVDKKTIWEAVQFNLAEVCSKCSGGVVAGTRYQVFHPIAHMDAATIVSRIRESRA